MCNTIIMLSHNYRFIALLLIHGENDWLLASLICQVLWNFCIDMAEISWLGVDQTTQLVETLVDFLGKYLHDCFVNYTRELQDQKQSNGPEISLYLSLILA